MAMQNRLIEELDSKIRNLIDEVEVLRVEIEELKIINKNLSDEQAQWEDAITRLLGKFDQLEQ
jgi:cell division protein ZapB